MGSLGEGAGEQEWGSFPFVWWDCKCLRVSQFKPHIMGAGVEVKTFEAYANLQTLSFLSFPSLSLSLSLSHTHTHITLRQHIKKARISVLSTFFRSHLKDDLSHILIGRLRRPLQRALTLMESAVLYANRDPADPGSQRANSLLRLQRFPSHSLHRSPQPD